MSNTAVGCLLVAIWTIGIAVIALNAMVNGFGDTVSGSTAGGQRADDGALIGFAILLGITVLVIAAQRRARR